MCTIVLCQSFEIWLFFCEKLQWKRSCTGLENQCNTTFCVCIIYYCTVSQLIPLITSLLFPYDLTSPLTPLPPGRTLWSTQLRNVESQVVLLPDLQGDSVPDLLVATLPADEVSLRHHPLWFLLLDRKELAEDKAAFHISNDNLKFFVCFFLLSFARTHTHTQDGTCLPCLLCHTGVDRMSSAMLGHSRFAIERGRGGKQPECRWFKLEAKLSQRLVTRYCCFSSSPVSLNSCSL